MAGTQKSKQHFRSSIRQKLYKNFHDYDPIYDCNDYFKCIQLHFSTSTPFLIEDS